MKKGIIVLIIGLMIGWAVYDFVTQSNASTAATEKKKIEAVENTEEITADIGLEIGQFAPDFELQTLDGESVRLSEYRGQRVLLNFWATWCPPCRAEMPDMQQFYENEDVVILAVNLTKTEKSREHVPAFVEDYRLTFPILLDEEIAVAGIYRIQPIPTTYFIDTAGRIHNAAFGALDYQSMLDQLNQME